MSQRVLLGNPPSTRAEPYSGSRVFGCTGLAHVAGYLRRAADCEIAIVDSPLEGLDFERTLERIEDFRPDVIGCSISMPCPFPPGTFCRALGVETGDEAILKRVGKGTTVDMILNARKRPWNTAFPSRA